MGRRLVGVVELHATEGWPFDAVDLDLLARFCERASNALAQACRFEDALLRDGEVPAT